MTREELKTKLHEAGTKFDGHVTNGSIEAQMAVLDEIKVKSRADYLNTLRDYLDTHSTAEILTTQDFPIDYETIFAQLRIALQ